MTAPTASASTDKSAYDTGETITLTVAYTGRDQDGLIEAVVTNPMGQQSAPATVPVTWLGSISVTDDQGRTWSLQSDDGATAVYTAVM